MANIIKLKSSTVAGKVPTVNDIAKAEPAANHTDKKLWLRNPATDEIWEVGAGASVTIDTTAADLLSFSSGTLSADDLGSDKIYFWDDSAAKATGLEIGSGLQISGTTLSATGTGSVSAIGTSAADVLSVSGSDIVADDPGSDKLIFWDDSESKLTHLTLGTGLSLTGTTLSAASPGNTNTYLVFNAFNAQPPATAFATFDTRNSIAVLDFDDGATNEATSFVSVIPEGANLTSGLKIRLHWMATSATSGVVRWGVQLERGDTDLDADSYDTAEEANATAPATAGIPTVTEITTTNLDGLTAGDFFRLRVYRDSSDTTNDTMTGDAELIAVEVRSAA